MTICKMYFRSFKFTMGSKDAFKPKTTSNDSLMLRLDGRGSGNHHQVSHIKRH